MLGTPEGRGVRFELERRADASDVELLVRHVRRQMPRDEIPVLVCADDLGRARMAAWPEARRRLSELPGVLILGAARREDLTPELSADATVIDPRLTDTAAGLIYDAVSSAGLPTVLSVRRRCGKQVACSWSSSP